MNAAGLNMQTPIQRVTVPDEARKMADSISHDASRISEAQDLYTTLPKLEMALAAARRIKGGIPALFTSLRVQIADEKVRQRAADAEAREIEARNEAIRQERAVPMAIATADDGFSIPEPQGCAA